MKIRIEDNKLGTFTWDTPAKFDERMADMTNVLRKRMLLSESDVSATQRVYIEAIERRIRGILALLTSVAHLGGPECLLIEALIDDGMLTLTVGVRDTLRALKNRTLSESEKS